MGHGPGGQSDKLAAVVALAAIAAAIGVYFAWTRPALAEFDRLDRIETEQVRLRERLLATLTATRQRQVALTWDLQTVLLAIDEAGATPSELLPLDQTAPDPRR